MASPETPGTELQPVAGQTINRLLRGEIEFPKEISQVIDMQGWARSLITREDYQEPDPDYLSRLILLQTFASETQDDIFKATGISKLQDSVGNVPGASTGPIAITGLYVTTSDFKEGARQYMILDTRRLDTGTERKYSTGSQGLQAQVLMSLCVGTWPIKCQIMRMDRKDKGDRYLFWLAPPDEE